MSLSSPDTGSQADSGALPWSWSVRSFSFFLGLLLVLCFWDVLLGFNTFVFRDYGLFGFPLAAYNQDSLRAFEIPLLNPYSNSGLPYLAQWNTMVLYPLSIVYILFPLSWSLPVFCIGHLWLGGLGMFVLLRRWTNSPDAAAIGGIAYALNGLMLNSLMWPNNIAALGLMPWVIWSAQWATKAGGRWVFIAALVGATQMLAGAPEIIIFTWALAGGLWIAQLLDDRTEWLAKTYRFVSVGIFVAALAAAQLLPFFELLQLSQRTAGMTGYESAMPPRGVGNLFLPLMHTYRSTSGVHFQSGQVWTSSYYVSILATFFAIFALRRFNYRVLILVFATIFSVVLALGNHGYLYAWLRKSFPAMAIMNFPIKFVVPVMFALPALSAFGFKWLMETRVKRDSKPVIWAASILSLVVLALAFVSYKFPIEQKEWPAVGRNAGVRLVFLAGAAAFCIYAAEAAARARMWLVMGLALMVGLDSLTHVPWQNPTVPPAAFEKDLQPVRQLTWPITLGQSRAWLPATALNQFRFSMKKDAMVGYIGQRMGLYDNCNLIERIPKVDGFYSLYLAHEAQLRRAVNHASPPAEGLLDFLGVSHYSNPTNIAELRLRSTNTTWVRIGAKPSYPHGTNVMTWLLQPNFNPSEQVWFEPSLSNSVRVQSRVADAKILASDFGTHDVRIKYSSPAETIVTVAQVWHPSWRATIDGVEAPVLVANHAYQALRVPAGEHLVELRYVDRKFRTGSAISGAAAALCIFGLIWTRKRRYENDNSGNRERPQG